MFNKKILLVLATIGFLFLLDNFVSNKFLKKKQENVPKIKIDRGGYLVSDSIGYVPNVFSWGFNRHICFDVKYKTWWIFYYKSNKKIPPWLPSESYIVYKYSKDNGKVWSKEIKLEEGNQAADFTIDCSPPDISIAYGDVYDVKEYQSKIFWKKGIMGDNSIKWFVSSTAMQSNPQEHYTRVIPSIVYYKGYPFLSVHDQSEQGNENGYQRVYVAVAEDSDGKKWKKEVVILKKHNKKRLDTIPFVSLAQVKDKLVAIINLEEYKLFISEYLGNNKWSDAKFIKGLNYGGGVPEWSTVTDSDGLLHILYPEKDTAKTMHAVFDWKNWRFEAVNNGENAHRTIGVSTDDFNNLYSISKRNLTLNFFSDGKWKKIKDSINDTTIPLDYVTLPQKVYEGKLGFAWVDGDERDPNIWFICMEKDPESFADFKKCQ